MPTIQKMHTGFIQAMVQSAYKFDAQTTKTIEELPMDNKQLQDFYCAWCGCNEKPIEEPFSYPYCPNCKGN